MVEHNLVDAFSPSIGFELRFHLCFHTIASPSSYHHFSCFGPLSGTSNPVAFGMLAALPSPSSATFCSTWIRVHTLRTQLVTDTTAITVPGSDAHNQPKHKDRPFRSQMIMRPTPPGIRPVLPRAPWAYTTATHPPVGHRNALTRHAERTNRRALDRLDSLICNTVTGWVRNSIPSLVKTTLISAVIREKKAAIRGGQRGAQHSSVCFPYSKGSQPSL